MVIISVVICLLFERFLSSLHTIRNFSWLESLAKKFTRIASNKSSIKNYVLIFLILLPAPILFALITIQLSYIFTPLEFIFSLFALFYSLGPETFYDRLKDFCQAKQNNDEASAAWFTEKIIRRPLTEKEKSQLPQTLIYHLFPIVNDRIFAPIFWFSVLGPFGAILYRLSSRLDFIFSKGASAPELFSHNVSMVLSLLNWLPARLCALGFMLMGNFSNSLHYCKQKNIPRVLSFHQQHSNALLSCIGSGSINAPVNPDKVNANNLKASAAIIRRNIELYVGVLALFTLMGVL